MLSSLVQQFWCLSELQLKCVTWSSEFREMLLTVFTFQYSLGHKLYWTLLMHAVSVWVYTNRRRDWVAGVCSHGWVGMALGMTVFVHPACGKCSIRLWQVRTPAWLPCREGDPGHSHITIQRCRCPEGDFRSLTGVF